MDTFGQLLKHCISVQNLTVYSIARDTGIDRSFLQSIFRGTKKLPQKRFTEIVNARFFTADQIAALCNMYYTEKFGKKEMKRIYYLENALTGKLKEELSAETAYKPVQLVTNKIYSGRSKVLSLVYTVMNDEEISRFESNFSFGDLEINSIVYNAVRKRKLDSFFHYVSDSKNNSLLDLQFVFYTLFYAESGYITHRYPRLLHSDLMPYFILTNKHFITIDEKGENAYTISADSVSDFLRERLDSISEECHQLVHRFDDAVEMMHFLDLSMYEIKEGDIIGFDNSFCPAFVTPEVAAASVTPLVKENPAVLKEFFEHFNHISNNRKIIVTAKAIEDFSRTGNVDSIPKMLSGPVPLEYRGDMIEGMIKNDSLEYYLANPQYFKSNYDFIFELFGTTLFINSSGDLSVPGSYIGEVLFQTEDTETCDTFKKFIEFYTQTEKIYSLQASRQFIQNYANSLRA